MVCRLLVTRVIKGVLEVSKPVCTYGKKEVVAKVLLFLLLVFCIWRAIKTQILIVTAHRLPSSIIGSPHIARDYVNTIFIAIQFSF